MPDPEAADVGFRHPPVPARLAVCGDRLSWKEGGDMSLKKWFGLIVIWLTSLMAATAWVRAQGQTAPLVPLATPIVVSGSDIGFRVEARRGDKAVGRWVIRSSATGQWVEPELAGAAIKPLVAD